MRRDFGSAAQRPQRVGSGRALIVVSHDGVFLQKLGVTRHVELRPTSA